MVARERTKAQKAACKVHTHKSARRSRSAVGSASPARSHQVGPPGQYVATRPPTRLPHTLGTKTFPKLLRSSLPFLHQILFPAGTPVGPSTPPSNTTTTLLIIGVARDVQGGFNPFPTPLFILALRPLDPPFTATTFYSTTPSFSTTPYTTKPTPGCMFLIKSKLYQKLTPIRAYIYIVYMHSINLNNIADIYIYFFSVIL